MDKKEFAAWAMALNTYYPRFNPLPSKESMALWYRQLNDIDAKIAELILHKWAAQNKWPPTIADIREEAAELIGGSIPDWGAGWQEVVRALGAYGHWSPKEALESMSEITRETVKRMGWNHICESENTEASRAHFRDIYNELAAKKKKQDQLPPEIKQLLSDTTKLLENKT